MGIYRIGNDKLVIRQVVNYRRTEQSKIKHAWITNLILSTNNIHYKVKKQSDNFYGSYSLLDKQGKDVEIPMITFVGLANSDSLYISIQQASKNKPVTFAIKGLTQNEKDQLVKCTENLLQLTAKLIKDKRNSKKTTKGKRSATKHEKN
jgi:hypothetical protein